MQNTTEQPSYRKHPFRVGLGATGVLAVLIGAGIYNNSRSDYKAGGEGKSIAAHEQNAQTRRQQLGRLLSADELQTKAMNTEEKGRKREALELWKEYTFAAFDEGQTDPYSMATMSRYWSVAASLPPKEREKELAIAKSAINATSLEDYFTRLREANPGLEAEERQRYINHNNSRTTLSEEDVADNAASHIGYVLRNGNYGDAQKIAELRDLQNEVGADVMYRALESLPNFVETTWRIEKVYPQYRARLREDPVGTLADDELRRTVLSHPDFQRLAVQDEWRKPALFFGLSALARGYNQVKKEDQEEQRQEQLRQEPYVPGRGWGEEGRPQVRNENPYYNPRPPVEPKPPPSVDPNKPNPAKDFIEKLGKAGERILPPPKRP